MDLGITLPTSGPYAAPEAIVRMAQEAEHLGYAAVWTYERLLYPLADIPQHGGPPRPLPKHYSTTYEPIETLSYVAAKTTSIKLGISVIVAPFHVPVVLARRLATLDQFSGGRVLAGLGQGWIAPEFVTANVPLARRGSGVAEFVAAMRAAWGQDPVAFEGRFYRIPESRINPKPVQEGGIPVLMGVAAPSAIERAAQFADGLNPIAMSFELLRSTISRFRIAAQSANRDPARLKIKVRANVPITDVPITNNRPFLGGSPEQIGLDLMQVSELCVDHVFFTNLTQPPLDDQVRLLERLQRAVTGLDIA